MCLSYWEIIRSITQISEFSQILVFACYCLISLCCLNTFARCRLPCHVDHICTLISLYPPSVARQCCLITSASCTLLVLQVCVIWSHLHVDHLVPWCCCKSMLFDHICTLITLYPDAVANLCYLITSARWSPCTLPLLQVYRATGLLTTLIGPFDSHFAHQVNNTCSTSRKSTINFLFWLLLGILLGAPPHVTLVKYSISFHQTIICTLFCTWRIPFWVVIFPNILSLDLGTQLCVDSLYPLNLSVIFCCLNLIYHKNIINGLVIIVLPLCLVFCR